MIVLKLTEEQTEVLEEALIEYLNLTLTTDLVYIDEFDKLRIEEIINKLQDSMEADVI